MGWKGTLRTGIAIARQMERAERRRANIAAKQYKALLKQEAFENGQKVVQEYNDYIVLISSTHKDTSEPIDWHEMLMESAPVEPVSTREQQDLAEYKFSAYVPTFFDKLFRLQSKKLKSLEKSISLAKEHDQRLFSERTNSYQSELAQWTKYQEFAKGAISRDAEVCRDIIQYFNPFSDIKELGSTISLWFENRHVVVTLHANGIHVIPDFTLTQTTTGKVSKKKLPVGRFNELYQDYICGCALRVGRELFSYLPLEFVFVNVVSELLNPATGHLENQTILSVAMPKATLEKLNFSDLDPSDSMRNFKHHMKFSKTQGFGIVQNLSVNELTI